ncbi:MAG: hypothetical protein P9L88_00045, partial [Candidatus Tantalella remota]|nr:hypothetical protein [Candidatus Tantalella remota]
MKNKGTVDGDIEDISRYLGLLKEKIYTEELLEMDLKFEGYKSGDIDFKGYILSLLDMARKEGVEVSEYPNTYFLSQAMEKEAGIDFKKANTQRNILIDELSKLLPLSMLEDLTVKTLEFRSGNLSQKDFYGYLTLMSKRVGVDLGGLPELKKFMEYLSLYEAADKFSVMSEMDAMEESIRGRLYENDLQKELVKLSRSMTLLENMFAIKLTREDYERYKGNGEDLSAKDAVAFIEKEAPPRGIDIKLAQSVNNLDVRIREISGFYEYSFKRDDVFIRNMKFASREDKGGRKYAMLITGGFHSDNLKELFRQNNISYVSIMPNFKNCEGYESPYFRLLAGGDDNVLAVLSEKPDSKRSALALYGFFCETSAIVLGSEKVDAVKTWVKLAEAVFTHDLSEGPVTVDGIFKVEQVPSGIEYDTTNSLLLNIDGKNVLVTRELDSGTGVTEGKELKEEDELRYTYTASFDLVIISLSKILQNLGLTTSGITQQDINRFKADLWNRAKTGIAGRLAVLSLAFKSLDAGAETLAVSASGAVLDAGRELSTGFPWSPLIFGAGVVIFTAGVILALFLTEREEYTPSRRGFLTSAAAVTAGAGLVFAGRGTALTLLGRIKEFLKVDNFVEFPVVDSEKDLAELMGKVAGEHYQREIGGYWYKGNDGKCYLGIQRVGGVSSVGYTQPPDEIMDRKKKSEIKEVGVFHSHSEGVLPVPSNSDVLNVFEHPSLPSYIALTPGYVLKLKLREGEGWRENPYVQIFMEAGRRVDTYVKENEALYTAKERILLRTMLKRAYLDHILEEYILKHLRRKEEKHPDRYFYGPKNQGLNEDSFIVIAENFLSIDCTGYDHFLPEGMIPTVKSYLKDFKYHRDYVLALGDEALKDFEEHPLENFIEDMNAKHSSLSSAGAEYTLLMGAASTGGINERMAAARAAVKTMEEEISQLKKKADNAWIAMTSGEMEPIDASRVVREYDMARSEVPDAIRDFRDVEREAMAGKDYVPEDIIGSEATFKDIVQTIADRDKEGFLEWAEVLSSLEKKKVGSRITRDDRKWIKRRLFENGYIPTVLKDTVGPYERSNWNDLNKQMEELLKIGEKRQVMAHGVEEFKGGIGNVIGIILDGRIGRREDDTVWIGLLADGPSDLVSGGHGPYYVIVRPGISNPEPADNHLAYLVPDASDKEVLIKVIRAAARRGVITGEYANSAIGKIATYKEALEESERIFALASSEKVAQESEDGGEIVAGASHSALGRVIPNVSSLAVLSNTSFGPNGQFVIEDGKLLLDKEIDVRLMPGDGLKDYEGNIIEDNGVVLQDKDGKFIILVRAGPTERMKEVLLHETIAYIALSGGVTSLTSETDLLHFMAKANEGILGQNKLTQETLGSYTPQILSPEAYTQAIGSLASGQALVVAGTGEDVVVNKIVGYFEKDPLGKNIPRETIEGSLTTTGEGGGTFGFAGPAGQAQLDRLTNDFELSAREKLASGNRTFVIYDIGPGEGDELVAVLTRLDAAVGKVMDEIGMVGKAPKWQVTVNVIDKDEDNLNETRSVLNSAVVLDLENVEISPDPGFEKIDVFDSSG